MVFRGYTHTEQVGRLKVTDGTGMRWVCPSCEEVLLSLDAHARYERRAAAAVLREGRHVDGAVLKYARRALGLRQARLAQLIEYQAETLSKWENDREPIPRATQLAIAALLEGVNLYEDEDVLTPAAECASKDNKTEIEVPPMRKRA